MIRINQVKLPISHSEEQLHKKIASLMKCDIKDIKKIHIRKRSLDARKKPELYYNYVIDIETDFEEKKVKRANNPQINLISPVSYQFPQGGTKQLSHRPVIIGEGPAGLFCGYFLAQEGYRPIILERGKDVDERQNDVDAFWKTGRLNPNSNVQFGEGGAGTFSDGKLNTLIKDKDGKNRKVLELFVAFGAPENILYENKPHIGTDILKNVVKNMRQAIESMGGEVRFEHEVTDFFISDGKLTGLEVNHQEKIDCEVAVLAIGHSARNTFQTLYDREIPMEAKAFAVGFRVEHPQRMINENQYGSSSNTLPAADYKLTAQTSTGRGVYSFCMCPGGYVVNASSEAGKLAVNGMSYSGRDGNNANSAIIVTVTPEDFEDSHPLAGIKFQRMLEEKAYMAGKGLVPVQYYGDYRTKINRKLVENQKAEIPFSAQADSVHMEEKMIPCIKGGYSETDLSEILPLSCGQAFVEGMEQFSRIIHGFSSPNALLSGVESRTSSPVRIHRDETGQSQITGLYPCGEGAGYAGGITSAAMDGITIAEKIATVYAKL